MHDLTYPYDPSSMTDIVPIIHSDLQHIRWAKVNANNEWLKRQINGGDGPAPSPGPASGVIDITNTVKDLHDVREAGLYYYKSGENIKNTPQYVPHAIVEVIVTPENIKQSVTSVFPPYQTCTRITKDGVWEKGWTRTDSDAVRVMVVEDRQTIADLRRKVHSLEERVAALENK